jgi:hypothetical protein
MSAPDPTLVSSQSKPQILRVFVSYAREDEKIAIAVFEALRIGLGTYADVFIDNALRFGLSFQDEIKSRLDETDLLVVIYSATLKAVYSFAGMELGYFMGLMSHDASTRRPRRIVPVYLETPPDVIAENEGINISISRATLAMSLEEYSTSLRIDSENPMVRFLAEFQEIVDEMRKESKLPKVTKRPEEQDLCGTVQKMQLSIFSHLKTTAESTLKPQKQITIKMSDFAPGPARRDLPPDASLIPMGTGNPMSIFGLPNQEISWKDFSISAKNSRFGDSWIDAITTVLTSSVQGQMETDNSQVIVSNDGTHAFRVILTTATRFFNGISEFNLYFVEYLNREDFGDPDTSLLLKGLELSCRFRFLFLEKKSEFSYMNIRIISSSAFHEIVRNLERELNLFRRDALEAGLDKPGVWADFVDWQILQNMSEKWRPLEAKIRECCAQIREAQEKPDALPDLRASLAGTVEQLETTIRPLNTELICRLIDGLKTRCACS